MPGLESKLLAISREDFERLPLEEEDKVFLRSQFVDKISLQGESGRLWIFQNSERARQLLRAA